MKKIKFYLILFVLTITFLSPLTVKAAPSPTTGMVIVSEENTKSENQDKEQTPNFRKKYNKHILKKKKIENIRKNRLKLLKKVPKNEFHKNN